MIACQHVVSGVSRSFCATPLFLEGLDGGIRVVAGLESGSAGGPRRYILKRIQRRLKFWDWRASRRGLLHRSDAKSAPDPLSILSIATLDVADAKHASPVSALSTIFIEDSPRQYLHSGANLGGGSQALGAVEPRMIVQSDQALIRHDDELPMSPTLFRVREPGGSDQALIRQDDELPISPTLFRAREAGGPNFSLGLRLGLEEEDHVDEETRAR